MKSGSKELLDRAIAATIAAIEIYNKPDFRYREEAFAVLAIHEARRNRSSMRTSLRSLTSITQKSPENKRLESIGFVWNLRPNLAAAS